MRERNFIKARYLGPSFLKKKKKLKQHNFPEYCALYRFDPGFHVFNPELNNDSECRKKVVHDTAVSLVVKEKVTKVQYSYKGKNCVHIDLGEIFGQ